MTLFVGHPKGMHIERIERDDVFCQDMLVKLSVKGILPNILTGVTTHQDKENEPPQLQEHVSQFCYCHKGEYAWWLVIVLLVLVGCVGLNSTPLWPWFYPDCKARLRK